MPELRSAQRPFWTCPRCGARLVTRNMWHSCGQFRIDDLFADAESGTLELARQCVAMLQSQGDVQVISQNNDLFASPEQGSAASSHAKEGCSSMTGAVESLQDYTLP